MIFFDRRSAATDRRSRPVDGTRISSAARPFRLKLLLPGLLLLFATACQSPVQQAESLAQQARALADSGDNRGALAAINQAIALRDDNPNYFMLLGAIQLKNNNQLAALKAYERVLELDTTNITALSYVANLGLQLGDIRRASAAADQLMTLDPNSFVGLQVKGLTALLSGHPDEADAYASKILAISPSDEAGTIVRARVMAKAGKFQEAVALIDKAMAVTGPTAALLVTKINLYRALQQPEAMVATYDQLMPRFPNPPSSFKLDRINLFYKLGKTDTARKLAQAFLSDGSNDASDYRTLQRIWFEFDPTPFDRDSIKQSRNWSDPLALLAVGRYLLWTHADQVADDLYFAARPAIQPIGMAIHARASLALGREKVARQFDTMILDRDKGDVDALLLDAQFKQEEGASNAALESAQKAVDGDPYDPETYIVLAGLHEAAGANWRAEQVFEDGLKQLPQNFLLIDRYTQFLHQLGDKNRAVSVTRSFARALPSSVKAWSIMAAQCEWAGDPICAAEAEKGRRSAQHAYQVDDPPGSPVDHGLLSKF